MVTLRFAVRGKLAFKVCWTNTWSVVQVGKASRWWRGDVLEKRGGKWGLVNQGASVLWRRVRNFHFKEVKCFQSDGIQTHLPPSWPHHHVTDLICDRKRQKTFWIRSVVPRRENLAHFWNKDKLAELFVLLLFFAWPSLFQRAGGSERQSTFTVIGFECTVVILQNESMTSF